MENFTYKCVPVPSMVEIGKNKTNANQVIRKKFRPIHNLPGDTGIMIDQCNSFPGTEAIQAK